MLSGAAWGIEPQHVGSEARTLVATTPQIGAGNRRLERYDKAKPAKFAKWQANQTLDRRRPF